MADLNVARFSIRAKLVLMGLVTSAGSLVLACAALFAYEILAFREEVLRKTTTQAEIISYNSGSAVIFADAEAAELTLSAIRSDPDLFAAAIYDEEGRLFAGVTTKAPSNPTPGAPPPGGARSHRFERGELALYQPIVVDGERVGTLLLRSDLGQVRERVWRFTFIASGVLLASLVVAMLLWSRLQRVISRPILELAETARAVAKHKDYSVRARAETSDEVGLFVEAFNDMLDEIQRREKDFESQTSELQQEVEARERAQRELARQADELMRSNRELENFAYVASHDLQEPLRMVASYTQLLAEEYRGRLDADADEYIDFAVQGAKRMQTLIHDLLSYSRITVRDTELGPVNAGAVLDDVLSNLSSAIEESGAVVTSAPLPRVTSTRARLTQVFQNLVANAIKYRRGTPEIRVSARPCEGECVFAVEDNGIGIAPSYFERIFQMFQRLHTSSEYEGTGIGLALCKKIVESQGGRIWVESTPGAGSCFYFSLPLAKRDLVVERPVPSAPNHEKLEIPT